MSNLLTAEFVSLLTLPLRYLLYSLYEVLVCADCLSQLYHSPQYLCILHKISKRFSFAQEKEDNKFKTLFKLSFSFVFLYDYVWQWIWNKGKYRCLHLSVIKWHWNICLMTNHGMSDTQSNHVLVSCLCLYTHKTETFKLDSIIVIGAVFETKLKGLYLTKE